MQRTTLKIVVANAVDVVQDAISTERQAIAVSYELRAFSRAMRESCRIPYAAAAQAAVTCRKDVLASRLNI